jgi:asparagine synthetase B (glutamine-hydrolysing)
LTPVGVLGHLDGALAWDGTNLYGDEELGPGDALPRKLEGLAGTARRGSDGSWRIVRDRLGIGKLFWARDAGNGLALAARPARLVDAGYSLGEISAVPRGSVIDLPASGPGVAAQRFEPPGSPGKAVDPDSAAAAIRAALDGYLAALAEAHPSRPAYVCLSGGLDSSGVAALVREHFPDAVAVSFELERGGEASEDRRAAERVARELDMPLLSATTDENGLLAHLDAVLVEGVDWRDFNVHAGLVNAALAACIKEADARGKAPLVFTGDLANEFLVDYHSEEYRGATYYRLPRLSLGALRSSLVQGLDTSHREVGVFGAWGLRVVQPYAVAVDAYLSLPESFLLRSDRKQLLCRAIFGQLVPAFVYRRPKARAQTGGAKGGGVLGLCVDRGINSAWLRGRFAELHGVSEQRQLDRFMRAGRYRTAQLPVAEEAYERA